MRQILPKGSLSVDRRSVRSFANARTAPACRTGTTLRGAMLRGAMLRGAILLTSVSLSFIGSRAEAQYINLNSPYQTNTESFYERMGIDFGFSLPGGSANQGGSRIVGLNPDGTFTADGSVRFSQNGGASAVPPFGGYDPNNDATFGFAQVNPNGGGFQLGLRLGQGNSRTSTSTTPNITVPNGIPGSINDTRLSPFVTGITPVVGGGGRFVVPVPPTVQISPLEIAMHRLQQEIASGNAYMQDGRIVFRGEENVSLEGRGTTSSAASSRIQSTATQADLSVAELRRRRAAQQEVETAEHQAEIEECLERAQSLIDRGSPGAARVYVRKALKLATGEQLQEIQQLYNSLR